MKMGWTGESVSSSITRRVCALTPWEMDKQELPSSTDIFWDFWAEDTELSSTIIFLWYFYNFHEANQGDLL